MTQYGKITLFDERRKKELARKLKQEEKRQRKLNKDKTKSEETPDQV